jgi:transporter family-2 protein
VVASAGAGALLIVVTAGAAPRIGVSLLTICLVAGMTAGALAFDRLGLAPGGRRPITPPRLAGALLALLAVVVIGVPGAGGDFQAAVFATVCGAGAAAAFQTAVNGRIRDAMESATVATFVVFVTALTILLAVLGVSSVVGEGRALDWPSESLPYTGGAFGALFVLAAAITVARLGVLRSTIATLLGQISAAIMLDTVAPVDAATIGPATVAGLALIFAAAVIANLHSASRAEPELPVPAGTAPGAE